MNRPDHPLPSEIQELIDGRIDESRGREVASHCEGCPRCRSIRQSLLSIDAGLRGLPLVETGPAFTSTLMNRLNLVRRSGSQTRLFEFFAFAFGLLLVLAVVSSAFLLAGGSDQGVDPATQKIVAEAGSALESVTKTIAEWIPLENLSGSSGARTLLFALLGIAMAAAADRVVRRRLVGG